MKEVTADTEQWPLVAGTQCWGVEGVWGVHVSLIAVIRCDKMCNKKRKIVAFMFILSYLFTSDF